MKIKVMPGLNVQWPWSDLIASGKKVVETRSYELPKRFVGVELAIIETPGKLGKKDAGILKARIIGTVVFSGSFKYTSKKDWAADFDKHLVPPDDGLYGFKIDKEKWAWKISRITKLDSAAPAPAKRGIVFTKECKVPLD